MSWGWSPSPRPLSASVLVIEMSRTTGLASQVSVATIVTVIGTSLWFEGESRAGDTLTGRLGGGCVSHGDRRHADGEARRCRVDDGNMGHALVGLRERVDDAQDVGLLRPDAERLLGDE